MAEETVLNNQLNNQTILNLYIDREKTDLQNQTVNGYRMIEKMSVDSGEADLYICEKDNQQYVFKLYRREKAIKQEIIDQLKKIESPYVAKMIDAGVYNGHPYEVIPYYKNGSVQGRRYSFEELKETIIPQLNQALYALHSHGIIHKDLKPSNIMLQDNGRDIALIDFGISSVKEGGNTIVLTKTGFTPEYTAHEAFNGLFLNESDYYSMGVTIFELNTGTTPYKNLSPEEIELYTSVQKVPVPDDMDQELKNLILGLTYYDITNRKEKTNPNRRWTYDEVCKWLEGDAQIIPGSGDGVSVSGKQALKEGYLFKGTEYTDRHKLAVAFAKDWKDAKKELFNGMLAARFKEADQVFAIACMDAEELYGSGVNTDLLFFRILYQLDETFEGFVWKGHMYNSLESLGKELQDILSNDQKNKLDFFNEIIKNRIISEYLNIMEGAPEELQSAVAAIEESFLQYDHTERQRLMDYYLLGYLLSGRRVFSKDGNTFDTVDAIIEYLRELLALSYSSFEAYCESLIDESDELDAQLEAWLIAIGKKEQIDEWKKKLGI